MLVLIRISLVILAASVIDGREGLVHFKTITRASILTRPRRNWPTSSAIATPNSWSPAPRRRRRGVKATPFGTRDGHDPERGSVLRPAPARASCPWPGGPAHGPGRADHPGSAPYLVRRSYSAQVWPRGRGCYLRMPARPG